MAERDHTLPADGVSIELILRSLNGKRVYMNTPVDNKPELLKHLIGKFVDQWMRDSEYLVEVPKPMPSKPYIMTIQIPPLPSQIVHTPECEHGLPTLVCPKCAPSAEEIENAPVEDSTNE